VFHLRQPKRHRRRSGTGGGTDTGCGSRYHIDAVADAAAGANTTTDTAAAAAAIPRPLPLPSVSCDAIRSFLDACTPEQDHFVDFNHRDLAVSHRPKVEGRSVARRQGGKWF
jgi:hypothetical protein